MTSYQVINGRNEYKREYVIAIIAVSSAIITGLLIHPDSLPFLQPEKFDESYKKLISFLKNMSIITVWTLIFYALMKSFDKLVWKFIPISFRGNIDDLNGYYTGKLTRTIGTKVDEVDIKVKITQTWSKFDMELIGIQNGNYLSMSHVTLAKLMPLPTGARIEHAYEVEYKDDKPKGRGHVFLYIDTHRKLRGEYITQSKSFGEFELKFDESFNEKQWEECVDEFRS